jgi:hypothetical protein
MSLQATVGLLPLLGIAVACSSPARDRRAADRTPTGMAAGAGDGSLAGIAGAGFSNANPTSAGSLGSSPMATGTTINGLDSARIDIKLGCHRCARLDANCGGEPPPAPPSVF